MENGKWKMKPAPLSTQLVTLTTRCYPSSRSKPSSSYGYADHHGQSRTLRKTG